MAQLYLGMPETLDLITALELSSEIANIEECDELTFDFAKSRLIEPFAMLLISSEIMRYSARCSDTKINCINIEHMGYAGHMGFFKSFGIRYGKAPGEAKGNASYIPLTIYSTQVIEQAAASKGIAVGDEVEEMSSHLASLLCHTGKGDVFDTLTYSIRELIRNVVEHSRATQFGICAQYWPSKSKAEVAILDRGIGIKSSLSNNPHLDASDDKRALNYALMPAVSGKAFKGSRVRQKGPWSNSGFGLYMTNRICRNGGTFFIGSGTTGMLLTKKSEAKRYYECDLRGTAVRMVLRTDQLNSLKDALDQYRNEGYEIQRRYQEIVNIDPSSASLMLSTDFDLSVWDKLLRKIKGLV